jgi:trehalose 6-phosphate synthase/phosphatase
VLSGREKATLDEWFGPLGIGLIAEHGAWVKEPGRPWELVKPLSAAWKTKLLPILKNYADRVPGAFVEEKEFSIVWHYRNAAPERGAMSARELSDDLLAFTANVGVQVQQANKSVEVRNAGVNKGTAAERWVGKGGYDFVLAIGDDRSDEDTFAILAERAYSIRVGDTPTRARFFLPGTDAVLDLLSRMAKRVEKSAATQPPAGPPTYH